MKSIRNALTLTILLTSLHSLEQGFSPALQQRFQTIIDSFQNDAANPFVGGMAVAVNIDGLAKWTGSTGYAARNIDADNNLLPGGSVFGKPDVSRIYSVTKTFTATLVLELVKEGKLSLSDPVVKYLPLLPAVNGALDPNVTLNQLLVHESGYSDYTGELQLQVAVAFDPSHHWTPYEMVSFVHQIAPPGSIREYSSTNYVLLGAIVEAATNQKVEDLFRQRFFDPLHLRSMYFADREDPVTNATLVAPHDNISPFNPVFQLTGQPTFPDAYTNISRFPMDAIVSLAFTSGGIVSNVADVAEWGNALYGGKATSALVLNEMLQSISNTPDKDGDLLGFGIIKSNKISGQYDFIGHDGNAPGYRAIMFYNPAKKMTFALNTNYHGANLYAVARELYKVIPDFICREGSNEKIKICHNGNTQCVAREAAAVLINRGAYIGGCSSDLPKTETKDNNVLYESGNKTYVAPNPFHEYTTLFFDGTGFTPASVSILDMAGKVVFRQLITSKNIEGGNHLKLGGLRMPAGIYTIRLQGRDGTVRAIKTIKQ